jgi:hypothetical protein
MDNNKVILPINTQEEKKTLQSKDGLMIDLTIKVSFLILFIKYKSIII